MLKKGEDILFWTDGQDVTWPNLKVEIRYLTYLHCLPMLAYSASWCSSNSEVSGTQWLTAGGSCGESSWKGSNGALQRVIWILFWDKKLTDFQISTTKRRMGNWIHGLSVWWMVYAYYMFIHLYHKLIHYYARLMPVHKILYYTYSVCGYIRAENQSKKM